MKQLLTKEDVAQAMKDLNVQGKKVTCTALHAALGNRGSMSTLLRLKAEVQGSEPVADSPAGLKTFREVWALAVTEGQQLQQIAIAQLREEVTALATENERLDGQALAADFERERALAELKSLQSGIVKAADETNRALRTLADERAAHAKELANIRQELASKVRKLHELELELTRLQVGRDPEMRGTTRERSRKALGFEAHSNGTGSAKRGKGGE